MDRQQEFLGALVNKVRGNDVLLNPAKLYPVLDAATSSLTTDPGLASLRGLYDLVRGVRHVPTDGVRFLTVPREAYAYDANRDQLVQPAARRLFARLRADSPVEVANASGRGDGPRGAYSYGDADGTAYEGTFDAAGAGAGPVRQPRGGPAADASPAPTFRGNTAAEDACK
jgi:hypothetical protein